MSMYAFIPFVIMLTSSVIIILRIAQQSKKLSVHEHKFGNNKESRFTARTRNLALMLIPVNFMFLIFVGPVVVAIYTYKDLGRDHLALVTVEGLSLCNFTLNFFIYFMTSSKFREEFYKLINEIAQFLKLNKNKRKKNFANSSSQTRSKIKDTEGLSKMETLALTANLKARDEN